MERMSDAGIISGYPDGTFRPEASVTLAEQPPGR
ncbi:MAG TPA: S-layer homology domain-containing protein [Symbiobacteriaceae bacterium]|nr:S-layer homology domain-containing protein [Symbiobacteriaceae bacterium]